MTPDTEVKEAGRELDALIAEKVMGLEHREWKPYYAPEGWFPREQRGAVGVDGVPMPEGYEPDLPCYSTDIAAAWQVVERLLSLGFWPDLISSHRSDGQNWRCEIDRYTPPDAETDPFPVSAISASAPHAICLAALAAVNAQSPEPSHVV